MTREQEQLLWAELDRQRGRELPPERLVQAAKRLGINYAACLPRWGTKRISTRRLRALAMRRSIEKECPA